MALMKLFRQIAILLLVSFGAFVLFWLQGRSSSPNQVDSQRGPADVFRSVLTQIKARTKIPILLPGNLQTENPLWPSIQKADANEYAIAIYVDDGEPLGSGANFYGFFTAKAKAKPPKFREVKLANRVTGFFRPLSCGGSCSPVNLWWVREAVLYHIQLKLSSTLSEQDQEKAITAVANSAILGGPR